MADREMLELAVKALGMPEAPKQYRIADGLPIVITYMGKPWNPLADDGDALRLAVQLMIRVSVNRAFPLGIPGSVTVEYPDRDGFYFALGEAVTNGDIYAATRRAITRAAAEIGRQMEVTG